MYSLFARSSRERSPKFDDVISSSCLRLRGRLSVPGHLRVAEDTDLLIVCAIAWTIFESSLSARFLSSIRFRRKLQGTYFSGKHSAIHRSKYAGISREVWYLEKMSVGNSSRKPMLERALNKASACFFFELSRAYVSMTGFPDTSGVRFWPLIFLIIDFFYITNYRNIR